MVRNIALIGFMGSGKTTVAKIIAERLDMPYVETDVEIERRSGMSIAEIFGKYGEEYFRQLERDVIQSVSIKDGQVISCGGGVTVDERNTRLLKIASHIIYLSADKKTLFERIQGDHKRPLTNSMITLQDLESLLINRKTAYAEYDLAVDTGSANPQETADTIIKWVRKNERKDFLQLTVKAMRHAYDIFVGRSLLDRVGNLMSDLNFNAKSMIFTNTTVGPIYASKVIKSLNESGILHSTYEMLDGERYKNLKTVEEAYRFCSEHRLERRSTMIALGGGVIGDTAGFVAGTYLRGINLIQIPTTLLAMVDSGIGGKTGVNTEFGKNLVGLFNPPKLVVVDTDVLATLTERDYKAGMVELLKHGLLSNPSLLKYMKDQNEIALSYKRSDALNMAIAHSCAVKAEVVEKDESDIGLREILNLGHTLGHAIEVSSGYGYFKHGEAVALGIIGETIAGHKAGLTSDKCFETVMTQISPYIPDMPIDDISSERIYNAMAMDKKNRKGKIIFSILKDIGKPIRGISIDKALILEAIDSLRDIKSLKANI